jgi:alpha-amylase/alpha-mannosidase (GH57 family)
MYQPPTQDQKILKKIDRECYKPLFNVLEYHDNAKICLNINGVLIDLLREFNLSDTIELLKNLVSEGKIEIVGTAKFHPILPLIPKTEVQRQIHLNEDTNKIEFGNLWKRKGFFPPEMAISGSVAKHIHGLGYKWVIMGGIACPIEWPYDKIYCSPNGLQLFFRDDILSNKISFKNITPKKFISEAKKVHKNEKKNNSTYIVIAQDAETFGHHIPRYEKLFLGKSLELINNDNEIETVFISELDQYFPISKETIIPKESSWSTTSKDLEDNIPYPLWDHPDNNIHKYYWKIMKSLINLMNLIDDLALSEIWNVKNYYNTARWFYNRGIHSCPTWWANLQRGTWSPNLIYKGVELLIKSALNAQMALVHAKKSDLGEGYFDSISYYHGLLLMEIYTNTKKNLSKFNNT